MLGWTQGSFELEPPDESAVLEEMDDSTEGLLMEGMRQLDEYKRGRREAARAVVADRRRAPAEGRSCASCRPRSWTCSRRRWRSKTVAALFDQSSLSDLEIAQKLVTLFEKGYLVAG